MTPMTWSNTDTEMVVSFLWETVYASRFELMAALLFVVGLRYGKLQSQQKQSIYKVALKPGSYKPRGQAGKASSRPSKAKSDAAPCNMPIDQISEARLKDPSFVIPQIVQLCRSQLSQALELYYAARQAGLKPEEVSAEERGNLYMQMVTAAIRGDETGEVKKIFSDLMKTGIGIDTSLLMSTVKLCTSKQLYSECLVLFDFVSKDPKFVLTDKTVWSCLLFCATEEKGQEKCNYFFQRLKECGAPQQKDYGNMLRLAGVKSDWQTALTLIQEMSKSDIEIESVQYNTALAVCVGAGRISEARTLLDAMELRGGVADVITYNTLMKGYAKAGSLDECFEIFERLKEKNLSPSQVTYGILLDGCINGDKVDRALELFEDIKKSGCQLNTILYTLLIKGFARSGDCKQAMNVYSHMQTEKSISPDLITFSILIKANCDSDRIEEALVLLGDMVSGGLKPDEVVFNNLISGCAKQGNAKLGKQLFADMIASRVRPSNATFSILIRMFHQSKNLEEAVEMIKKEPQKHRVEPEPRLFLQLIQCCIRERQGRRAVEVYEILCERTLPTQAMHSSILSTCRKLHMYDTAAEILQIAASKGAYVSQLDTNSILEGAFKKGKAPIVRSCIAQMQILGHHVDSRFVV